MEKVYDITVTDNTTVSSPWSNQWDWGKNTTPTYDFYTTNTMWYSPTVYLYQITCPRCKTQNWAEVDKIVDCKGQMPARIRNRKTYKEDCLAKLKAVKEIVDYEIPVT